MATTGKKFLELSNARTLWITPHALYRIRQQTGVELPVEEAAGLFDAAQQLRPAEMFVLGYRPNHSGRWHRGVQTWYFRFCVDDQEFIAVVQQGRLPGEFIWITTYARSPMSDAFALCRYAALAG